jgi:mono/diheme cytochrome c family protein
MSGACIGLMMGGLMTGAVVLLAQTQSSVWDGIYSTEQAKRGEAVYARNCASCHGAKLEGRNQASPLVGAEFLMNWDGARVGDLFEKMQTSMPGDKPGSLSAGENAEILAFMLSANQFPSGRQDLPGDTERLKQIRFSAKQK